MKPARFIVLAAAIFAVVFLCARTAAAADNPSPTLDAVATSVAGHAVHVYCENDPAQWTHQGAWGFTYSPQYVNTVWIHPWICETLHDRLDGKPVTLNAIAMAIHVVVHESVHQRGGVFADCNGADLSCEGRTDCMALTLDPGVAETFFSYPRTVTTMVKKTVTKTVKKKGKRVRVRHIVSVPWTVPSQDMLDIQWYWTQMHRGLPVEYQGGC